MRVCSPRWLAFALVACTCSGPPEPPDAGARDGGAADSGADAGVDAGFGFDAGTRDEPRWRLIEGLPAPCEIAVAENPMEIAGPLVFEPCPGRDGCRQLVVDWESVQRPRFLSLGPQYWADGVGHFLFARGEQEGWLWLVAARGDGTIDAVVRTPRDIVESGCAAQVGALSANRLVLSVVTVPDGRSLGDTFVISVDVNDRLASPAIVATLSQDYLQAGNAPQFVHASDELLGLDIGPRSDVLRVDAAGATSWLSSSERDTTADAVAGMTLYYSSNAGGPDSRVYAATPGSDGVRLIGSAEFDAFSLRTDGETMIWGQHYERLSPGVYQRVELWASPMASRPADLVPRRVLTFPAEVQNVMGSLYYGHGHIVAPHPDLKFLVYAIDGTPLGEIAPDPGTDFLGRSVAWVGPEDVAYAPRRGAFGHTTLRIVRYDALDR